MLSILGVKESGAKYLPCFEADEGEYTYNAVSRLLDRGLYNIQTRMFYAKYLPGCYANQIAGRISTVEVRNYPIHLNWTPF